MGVLKPLIQYNFRKFSTGGVRYTYGPLEVQRSSLMNGIRVAAAKPQGAMISACTIMFHVGSRHEVDNELGVSHFLRAMTCGTGCGSTQYNKMRMMQQHGCSITCTSDRQRIAYTLRCPLPCFDGMTGYLLDTASRACFPRWETDDCKEIILKDLVRLTPEERVMDMIQTASFTGPLSNSVHCVESRVPGMEDTTLRTFVDVHYKTDVCTVASYGLPFENTLKLAEQVQCVREMPEPRYEMGSLPRAGFEYYDMGRDADTWIAIAVPGTGTGDLSCLFNHAIVAAAAGYGNMQMGQHFQDRTPMTPLSALACNDVYTVYKAFNISYNDTGLFGILVRTRARSAWNAAVSAAQFLTNIGDLTCDQIIIGKTRLQLSLARHYECPVRIAESLAMECFNNVKLDSARQVLAYVDSICPDDVCCTAKVLSSKCKNMSLAIVGDIGAVPHDRELTCGSICDYLM